MRVSGQVRLAERTGRDRPRAAFAWAASRCRPAGTDPLVTSGGAGDGAGAGGTRCAGQGEGQSRFEYALIWSYVPGWTFRVGCGIRSGWLIRVLH